MLDHGARLQSTVGQLRRQVFVDRLVVRRSLGAPLGIVQTAVEVVGVDAQPSASADQHQSGQVLREPQCIVQGDCAAHGVTEQDEGRVSLSPCVTPHPVHVSANAVPGFPVRVAGQVDGVGVFEPLRLVVVGQLVLAGAMNHHQLHRAIPYSSGACPLT